MGIDLLCYSKRRIFFEFVAGFVSLVTLEYICDVFDGMCLVPRSGRGYPCTSYLNKYSIREFFGSQSCRLFYLEARRLSKGWMKGGPLYLLLCTSMYSVDFVALSHQGRIEDDLLYDFQVFGRYFTYNTEVVFAL